MSKIQRPGFNFKIILSVVIIIVIVTTGILWLNPASTPPRTGWPASTPEEQGMYSTKFDQTMEFIVRRGFAVDSVVVVRRGYIVLEEYPSRAYSRDSLHELYSVTKSFTSALIGIAIREGFIKGVEQKVLDFFPERTVKNLDSRKENIRLEHLLTMTSGLEWDESTYPYGDVRSDVTRMSDSGDPIQYVLDRPTACDPGVEWVYNSGCSHLLSAIIARTTGYTTLEFARKFLFDPLGISNVEWQLSPQGVYWGAGGCN